jgi:hypothetical protein
MGHAFEMMLTINAYNFSVYADICMILLSVCLNSRKVEMSTDMCNSINSVEKRHILY